MTPAPVVHPPIPNFLPNSATSLPRFYQIRQFCKDLYFFMTPTPKIVSFSCKAAVFRAV